MTRAVLAARLGVLSWVPAWACNLHLVEREAWSRGKCTPNVTFGCVTLPTSGNAGPATGSPGAMWVRNGCHGVFLCSGVRLKCGAKVFQRRMCECANGTTPYLWPLPYPPLPPGPPASPPISIFSPSPMIRHRAAKAPPASEGVVYDKYRPCPTFRGAFLCGIEADEWTLARALITPSSTVLEFGARFGTTSCLLSQMTNNSGFVASVEIDSSVFDDLEHNRRRHHCNFLIVRAAVSWDGWDSNSRGHSALQHLSCPRIGSVPAVEPISPPVRVVLADGSESESHPLQKSAPLPVLAQRRVRKPRATLRLECDDQEML